MAAATCVAAAAIWAAAGWAVVESAAAVAWGRPLFEAEGVRRYLEEASGAQHRWARWWDGEAWGIRAWEYNADTTTQASDVGGPQDRAGHRPTPAP